MYILKVTSEWLSFLHNISSTDVMPGISEITIALAFVQDNLGNPWELFGNSLFWCDKFALSKVICCYPEDLFLWKSLKFGIVEQSYTN